MKRKLDHYKYMYSNLWKWNRGCYFWGLVRSVMVVVLPLCVAAIPKLMIDMLTAHVSLKAFLTSIVILSGLVCLIAWIEPFLKEKLAAVTENVRMKYRVMAFEKLLKVDYDQLERYAEQQKYQKAKTFLYAGKYTPLLDFIDMNSTILSSLLGIILFSVFITMIHPLLIFFILFVCAAEYGFAILLKKFELTIVEKEIGIYTKFDYLYRVSVEEKNGKDIRLFSAQQYFTNIVLELLKTHNKMMAMFTRQTVKYTALEALLSLIREIVIYSCFISSVLKQEITVADFVFLFGVATGFTSWITALSQQLIGFYEINKQCGYYRDFIGEEKQEAFQKKGVKIQNIYKIAFQNVTFSYDGCETVLDDVSFTINAGESIALVGGNGAGKTTIIKLLCGFYKPQKGTIYINDIDLDKVDKSSFMALISAVFQDSTFLPMAIQNNIAMTQTETIDLGNLEKAAKEAGISDQIEHLKHGYETKMVKQVYEDATNFSGGESQRILLARALYKNTDLLILDEPTSALDPIAESKIYEQYKKLMCDKISIFVSHRLASTQFCKQILFLKNGCVTEVGTHQELIKQKNDYWKMFKTQSHYYEAEGNCDEK